MPSVSCLLSVTSGSPLSAPRLRAAPARPAPTSFSFTTSRLKVESGRRHGATAMHVRLRNMCYTKNASVRIAAITLTRCRDPGSNWGPSDLQSGALPAELSRHTLKLFQVGYYYQRAAGVCASTPHTTHPAPGPAYTRARVAGCLTECGGACCAPHRAADTGQAGCGGVACTRSGTPTPRHPTCLGAGCAACGGVRRAGGAPTPYAGRRMRSGLHAPRVCCA